MAQGGFSVVLAIADENIGRKLSVLRDAAPPNSHEEDAVAVAARFYGVL
ncbi:MAG: hypothetical protein ACFCA4_15660 [Cyanophyceae cyanobacterium]